MLAVACLVAISTFLSPSRMVSMQCRLWAAGTPAITRHCYQSLGTEGSTHFVTTRVDPSGACLGA